MARRVVTMAGILAVLVIAGWAFITVRSFNHFDTVINSFDGECSTVAGIAGPEDLQIDFINNKAFISSFDRRANLERERGAPPLRGAIHLFDLADPLNDRSWRDLTAGTPSSFQPLGLHFYRDKDVARLFVVNAALKSVELYDLTPDGDLVHIERFTERRLTSPNDVVAIGPRSFYVSNDNNSGRASFKANINFLFRRGTGKVMYFNGVSWHEAASDIQYANGLSVNRLGTRLYVAETAGENLLVYNRDISNGYLSLAKRINVNAAVDNINIDQEGQFWIGAHPRPLALLRHQRDRTAIAPSAVYRYNEDTGAITNVYADDGTILSGSSSAARAGRHLVIGALFEEKFLICRMGSQPTE